MECAPNVAASLWSIRGEGRNGGLVVGGESTEGGTGKRKWPGWMVCVFSAD